MSDDEKEIEYRRRCRESAQEKVAMVVGLILRTARNYHEALNAYETADAAYKDAISKRIGMDK